MIEVKKVGNKNIYRDLDHELTSEWQSLEKLTKLPGCNISAHAIRQRILEALKEGYKITLFDLVTKPKRKTSKESMKGRKVRKNLSSDVDWGILTAKWVA